MDSKRAIELGAKIIELQTLMVAYVTDGRTSGQPTEYRDLYADVTLDLEADKYANPNPHKTLQTLWAYCKLQNLNTYASRRLYIEELYADILFDLKRIQKRIQDSKTWKKANEALSDELTPVRAQWLKAKNFIYASSPDYENSIKESINAVESCLMILLNRPGGTLGKIIKEAHLDLDIERLISQAYGYTSNRAFVRHGGTEPSNLGKAEAEFFLEFAASSIIYLTARLKTGIS